MLDLMSVVDSCGNTDWFINVSLSDTTKKITKIEILGVTVPYSNFIIGEYDFSAGTNGTIIEKKLGCRRPPTFPPQYMDVCDCYEILVTFENGDTCILPLYIYSDNCKCGRFLDDVVAHPVPCCPGGGSHLEVSFTLAHLLPSPLIISIVTPLGIPKIIFYDDIPTSLQNNISVDISSLTTGVYYIKFQTDSEIFSVPFIKQ